MKNFNGDEFAFQVIAKGCYVDLSAEDGKVFIIEATTLRLNHVALSEAIMTHKFNVRECYNTDAEWEAYKAEINERERRFTVKIANGLGISTDEGEHIPRGFTVCQAQSEVFTAVYIYEKEVGA